MKNQEKTRKGRRRGSGGVAYQNKDISVKVFASHIIGGSMRALGVPDFHIKQALSTNLPEIRARELKMDNFFLLDDDSYLIMESESKYRERNRLKYFRYVVAVAERVYNETKRFPRIRLLVLYTADVRREETTPVFDLGAARLTTEEVFLSELDSEAIYRKVTDKLDAGERVDEDDAMLLAIYPLTYIGDQAKQEAVRRAIDLAIRIPEEEKKQFILAAVNVFADKVITEEDRQRVRREITMTKLGQEFWDDAIKAGREAERRDEQKRLQQIVGRLLQSGDSAEKVSQCTEVPLSEVLEIQAGMLQEA